MCDYTPELLVIIALSIFVKIGADGALTAIDSAILPSSVFGFNKCAMFTFANPNPGVILDRRLPQFLAVGSDLVTNDTHPIVLMNPNHKGATEHFDPLTRSRPTRSNAAGSQEAVSVHVPGPRTSCLCRAHPNLGRTNS